MEVDRFRSQFPGLQRLLYLNHASEAPVSGPVRRRVEEYLDIAEGDPDAAPPPGPRIRELLARLLGGLSEEWALIPNTTTALGIVAGGLHWEPGDNVVLPAEEFPANAYPWLNLRSRGVEVRVVPLDADLRVPLSAVAERVDHRTRVVTVSAVEYLSGYRNDLRALSRIAHDSGALFVVDGIQAAGAVPIDVVQDGIDVLAAGGFKWLLGPVGTGCAYFARDVWEQIWPVLPGACATTGGSADAHGAFDLHPTAQRYESGCLAFSLFHGWTAGLEMLLEAGLEGVHQQIMSLTGRLITGLKGRGIAVASPQGSVGERSGIVSFTLGSHEANEALVRRLYVQGIVIALRGGRCRVSPHFYNTAGEIDRLLEALA